MTERIIMPLSFTPPSQQLSDMLAWLEEAHLQMMHVAEFEYQHEELLTATELTPLQVDRLLTRGCHDR